ncbi:MAG TPA: DUF885 domain-containing protein [Pseudobdellovibrionaceae bacterium]|nr:DUF885 domain-containing protein [Pseudobdellovibrionaceae bacterium]
MRTQQGLLSLSLATFVVITMSACVSIESADSAGSAKSSTAKKGGVSSKEKLSRPNWVNESDVIAARYTHSWSELYPEMGSGMGYREYDKLATAVRPELDELSQKKNLEWKSWLATEIARTSDQELRTDLEVLLEKVELSIGSRKLEDELGVIPFEPLTKSVFYSLLGLVNDQNSADRKAAAVDRFHKYVFGVEMGGGVRSKPRSQALMQLTETKIKEYSSAKGPSRGRTLWPNRREVEQYLKDSQGLLIGVGDLLKKSGRQDWENDFKAFSDQVHVYDAWVKKEILPKSRRDDRVPMKLYEYSLKARGMDISAKDLAARARVEWKKNLQEYRRLASVVAEKHKLKDKSPAAVILHLKREIESDPQKVLAAYHRADQELSEAIRQRDLMTLPSAPLRIRLASKAESLAQPVPHLNSPSFVGNTGERPEFVVPVADPSALAFDDFAFAAAAKSLTAHEGRPGHDLQFSSMLDRGVSMIRANYAFNNVNVEGWGLYAEWLMMPSMSDEEKLGSMMMRMMRNARMFLDPELHLGKLTPDQAKRIIVRDVGMTGVWADLELRRYLFEMPGQAPSYYFGLMELLKIRDEVMKRMGDKFQERCFHDAILDAGLLPLGTLRKRMESLQCPLAVRDVKPDKSMPPRQE